jgi:Asp/Glu/hydantoin racemase
MKLAFTQPVPFSEDRDKALENIYRENFKTMAREGTTVDIFWLKNGYCEPTYAWTETYNSVEMVKTCYQAWKTGYDGIVIGSTQEPGLIEARSVVGIPVIGITESSAAIASSIGARFSILCLHQGHAALVADKIRRYGLSGKLVGVRYGDFSAVEARELYSDIGKMLLAVKQLASKAVEEDKAEVIIPACTILSSALTNQGLYQIDGVPIIDPVWAGIKMAEVFVDLKLTYGIGVCRNTMYATPNDWEQEIPIPLIHLPSDGNS